VSSVPKENSQKNGFRKARELKVVVSFEIDSSPEGIQRSQQAKMMICEMILLSKKRGRVSMKEEDFNEAA
jgi:hypothetical protein